MTFRKRLLAIGSVLLVLMGFCVIYTVIHSGSSIMVNTDTTPIKLELNDKTYTIESSEKHLRVPADVYNYRASATVDGKRIVLVNKLDLQKKEHADLTLSFSIYTTAAIRATLCADYTDNCPFTSTQLLVTYVENNQWAVVRITDPVIGSAAAVLTVKDGAWEISGGPGTDFVTGTYPASVEKELGLYGS